MLVLSGFGQEISLRQRVYSALFHISVISTVHM
jgi:hypothetical protein